MESLERDSIFLPKAYYKICFNLQKCINELMKHNQYSTRVSPNLVFDNILNIIGRKKNGGSIKFFISFFKVKFIVE